MKDDGPTGNAIAALRGWRASPLLTLILACGAFLLMPLRHGDLQKDASVYAFTAKRIAATGDFLQLFYDWEGNEPYFLKPPIQFWLTAAVYRALGYSPASARLVPAALYLLAAALLYRIVRISYPREIAATAALAFCLHREVLGSVLEVRIDAGLICCLLLSTLGAARMLHKRDRRGGDMRCWLLIGLGCGLGLMVKGGAALLSLPVIIAAFAWARRWDLLRAWRGHLAALATCAVLGAPWYLYQRLAFAQSFTEKLSGDTVVKHTSYATQELVDLTLYYVRRLPEVYFAWLPLTALGAWAMYQRRAGRVGKRRRLNPVDRLALAWIIVYFISIHGSAIRSSRYLMPLFPWLGLLAAVGIYAVEPVRRIWRRHVLPYAGVAMVGLCAILNSLDVPLARTAAPELHRVVPLIRESVSQRTAEGLPPEQPRVYLYGSKNEQQRCLLRFYTDARVQCVAEASALGSIPRGQYVAIFLGEHTPESIRRGEQSLGDALLLSAGKRFRFYLTR
jgi:4-amino-4-deoxy-L-arabinose transferase-like glycosyltransferase